MEREGLHHTAHTNDALSSHATPVTFPFQHDVESPAKSTKLNIVREIDSGTVGREGELCGGRREGEVRAPAL